MCDFVKAAKERGDPPQRVIIELKVSVAPSFAEALADAKTGEYRERMKARLINAVALKR